MNLLPIGQLPIGQLPIGDTYYCYYASPTDNIIPIDQW